MLIKTAFVWEYVHCKQSFTWRKKKGLKKKKKKCFNRVRLQEGLGVHPAAIRLLRTYTEGPSTGPAQSSPPPSGPHSAIRAQFCYANGNSVHFWVGQRSYPHLPSDHKCPRGSSKFWHTCGSRNKAALLGDLQCSALCFYIWIPPAG